MKSICLRFYAELNDFLPEVKKQVMYSYSFWGAPSIKDIIESEGIPHTEVDLILANGKSVGFDYRVKQNDEFSIYPVFESIDITPVIHLLNRPLRNTKFVADVHLGKLAKYLRMLGFDTLYRNDYEDNEIVSISLSEKRIILTRDIFLLKKKEVSHGYFVRNTDSKEQIEEIVNRFDLYFQIKPLTRCILCNDIVTKINKSEILHKLEPKTRMFYNEFYKCKKCNKIYWKGSHYERMYDFIESLRPSN
jgi:uncharacterized protein with PIN domain